MIIQESDYKIETDVYGYHWDLSLIKTVRPKGKPERQEWYVYGYGMPLEKCISCIVNYRIAKKQDVWTLREYLNEYKRQISELKTLINSKLDA